MRVWIVTSELPHEHAGGIGRYVDNFARTLGAAGHDVLVLYRSDRDCDEQPAPGVRTVGFATRDSRLAEPAAPQPDAHPAFPYNLLDFGPALAYQAGAELFRLLESGVEAPDIIEVQDYSALGYFPLQRKLTETGPLDRIPIIVHMHSAQFDLMQVNQWPRYRFPEYWLGQMEKFCLRAADAVLSPSEFLKNEVQRSLGRDLDIRVIPYPFVTDYDQPPGPGEAGEVLYVGRLEYRKGVMGLIQACDRLWAQGVDFRLTMLGGDTEFAPRCKTIGTLLRERYAKWIERGRLNLAGTVPFDRVCEYMQRAAVTLVPSLWENYPNTAIEAMAAGRVTLVSAQGGQAEMVAEDGRNGFIFDWNVPGDLERQLRRVLNLDAEERTAIGRRAQERIRSLCEPQRVLAQRLEHYQQIIARHLPRLLFPSTMPADVLPPPPPAQPGPQEQPDLLSVVIPYYNLGAYVDETLASVLASTYRPLEIVIVDDGSTDAESISKLADIEARRWPNLRVVRTPNQGLPGARNAGADHARGEFLCFIDADDTVEPDYFARATAVLRRHANVGFVYSWVRWFEGATNVWITWNAEFPYLLGHNMTVAMAVQRRQWYLQFARNRPELAYALEDFEMWISLLKAGALGVALPAPLVNYRVRRNSMLRQSQTPQRLYLHDVITGLHADLFQRFGAELYNLQNANGPAHLWNQPALAMATPEESRHLQAELKRERAVVAELREWIRQVEEARDWHNQHRQMAEEALGEAQAQLQATRAACEEQLLEARAQLQAMRQTCAAWRRQLPYRVLRRAGILADLRVD
jgi:glycogen(starch) synthase